MPVEHSNIKYLERNKIDIKKWDQCIDQAANGLIYAKSFVLDCLSKNWSALVWNDYETVMPLTWNKKFFIRYLYQPPFVARLGIFGNILDPGIYKSILANIPSKFRYIDIDMNEGNNEMLNFSNQTFAIRKRLNLLLPLSGYEQIHNGYKRLAKRMIRKATEHGIRMQSESDPAATIDFYYEHYSHQHPHLSRRDFDRLISFCKSNEGRKHIQCYRAISPEGEILAAYLLFSDSRYIYSVLGGSTNQGKDLGAFYLLTDAALKHNCQTKKVFRFEGSDLEGIAFFDRQFGSFEVYYPHLIQNRLPWPLKIFKQ
jgi:hypothetical protein